MLSQRCLINSLAITHQEWLSITDATCRPLYPRCHLCFLPRTISCAFMWSWTTLPLRLVGAPARWTALPLHPSPFFLFLVTFQGCIVQQFSKPASGRFTQIWRKRRPAKTQMKQLECLPTILLLEVLVERVIIKTLLQNRGEVWEGQGLGALRALPFFFNAPVSVSFPWLKFCTHPCMCSAGTTVASHICTCTALTQLSLGSVSLWLITVCSPPADAGSGSGDDGKISHHFL